MIFSLSLLYDVESHNNFYFTTEKNMSFDYELNKINLHGGANKGD